MDQARKIATAARADVGGCGGDTERTAVREETMPEAHCKPKFLLWLTAFPEGLL